MVEPIQADVLIVGGGPAGLCAAEAAASSGVVTLLLEREEQIGSPVHTSGATAIQIMHRLNVPQQLYHPIRYLRFCSPNEVGIFDYAEPVICVVDVRGFYQYLAERALNKGATILTGIEAIEPVCDGGFVTGCKAIRNGLEQVFVSCKILIDASGYGAAISKKAGLHAGFARFGVGAEYELIAPNCRQDEMVIIVGSQYAPSGYAWVFPWGNNRVRLGVGILHPDSRADPRDYLKILFQRAGTLDINLTGAKIIEHHNGMVPSDGLAPNMVGNSIMAVGDAAGQASLIAGEGIRLSLQSGQIAGDTAARAVLQGKRDRQALLQYERQFRSMYGRDLSLGHMVNRRMTQWDDNKWDERLRALKTMSPALVINLLRSRFPLSNIFSWLVVRPRWWPKTLQFGIRVLAARLRG